MLSFEYSSPTRLIFGSVVKLDEEDIVRILHLCNDHPEVIQ